MLSLRMKLCDVARHRSSDTHIQQSEIAGQRSNEDPDTVGAVAEMAHDERREKEGNEDRKGEAAPIGNNVAARSRSNR